MKAINLDHVPPSWPGYPHAVTAGGFCFISCTMGLNADGVLISNWSELPEEGASLASGFASVDVVEGPPGAQTWAAFHQLRSLMGSLGGDLDDVLQWHYYQKEKRFFPIFERVKMMYEPKDPAPGSGVGVCGSSPDGNAWFVLDGIAVAPREWRFGGRRTILRHSGERAPGSHYSQAVLAGPYIFLAGHIANDISKPGYPVVQTYEDIPEEGRFLQIGRSHPDFRNRLIASQTWFTYDKMRKVLKAADSGMEDVVNVTIFLQDMKDYHTFHRVHEHFFPRSLPAVTITEFREVGHKGTVIEIEMTAMKPANGVARKTVKEAGSITPGLHGALATVAGPLVFLSGQVGQDGRGMAVRDLSALPRTVRPHAAGIARMTGRPEATFQAVTIFANLQTILKEVGCGLDSVARIILYLEDFGDFTAFDGVCRQYLPGAKPALSCIAIPRVSPIPGIRMCVEATAVIE